jgi:hypothetical protein
MFEAHLVSIILMALYQSMILLFHISFLRKVQDQSLMSAYCVLESSSEGNVYSLYMFIKKTILICVTVISHQDFQ